MRPARGNGEGSLRWLRWSAFECSCRRVVLIDDRPGQARPGASLLIAGMHALVLSCCFQEQGARQEFLCLYTAQRDVPEVPPPLDLQLGR